MFLKCLSYLLVVGDYQTTLIRYKGSRFEKIWTLTALSELPSEVKSSSLTLLLNTSEQKIHQERLPKLSYLDTKRFLHHTFDYYFEKGNLLGCWPFKKTSFFLEFISAECTSILEGWLNHLKKKNLKLSGIYSLPVEALRLIEQHLNPELLENSWVLLITRHGNNGIRHIIFFNRKIIFTRMVNLKAHFSNYTLLAREIESSALSSLAYLQRLSQFDNQPIRFMCFDCSEVLENIQGEWMKSLSYDFIPLACSQVKNEFSSQHEADLLHAQSFIKTKSPLLPLKYKEFKRYKRRALKRFTRYSIALVTLSSALSLSYLEYDSFTSFPKTSLAQEPSLQADASSSLPHPPVLDETRLKNSPYLQLNAVIFTSTTQWTVWLNGKRLTPKTPDLDVTIHNVTPSEIYCTWHHYTQDQTITLKLNQRLKCPLVP